MSRKISSVIVCMVLIATAFAAVFLSGMKTDEGTHSEATTIEYEFRAGDYQIVTDEQGEQRIEMLTSGYYAMDSPGDPALPQRILEFRVPLDTDWESVELDVDIRETERLSGFNIAPSPPSVVFACSGDEESADWGDKSVSNGRNMKVYGTDAIYPASSIGLLPYTERKEPVGSGFEFAKFLRVAYRPFQYNPVRDELTLVERADIRIDYGLTPSGMAPETPMLIPADYVIITTNHVVDNSTKLDSFVYLKELMGHNVRVVTEDDYDVLTGQDPNGTAERIRQWLFDNYVALGIDYVLLIGDPNPDDPRSPDDWVGDIPMKLFWPAYHNYEHRAAPSDYFYADLTGDWNLDGDMFYGETVEWNHSKSPDPAIGEDTFSAEWNGQVMIDYDEDYKFHTWSDDGVELYIDGVKVIDNWVEHEPANDWTDAIPLTIGKHDITVKFRENTGDGIIKLYWKTTSSSDVKHAKIPDSHLYDMLDVVGGLDATYYDNADFTGPTVTRKDPVVSFHWLTGDRGPAGSDTGAEVFVGRIPMYGNDYEQLDAILYKTIKYQTDPGDISWRETILLPMKPLWADTPAYHLGEGIKSDTAIPAGFSYYRIYQEDYGVSPEMTPCSSANVVDEWKNGYGMVVWTTHGSATGASHVFSSGMTDELDDSKPAHTFQGSCNNGYPSEPNNLGYALLKEGAISTISASRVSWDYHGNWTFDPSSAANHNLAYYHAMKFVLFGMTTGASFYLTKGGIANPERNTMVFNLYGDPALDLYTVVPNAPPVAEANGPYMGYEGSVVVFDATGSYDPEGDPLEYRWDFDNDGTWDTDWSTDSTASYTWGDDYSGTVKVEVQDLLGHTGDDVADVTVLNVDPTIENVKAYILVDFTLRVAGEKWHNVEMYIYEDGTQIGYAEVVRYPGSPDDQSQMLVDIECDITKEITVKVVYTPLDDPVNGQIWGASPVWVNVSFEDGGYNLTQHNFNVRHPDTWEWILGVNQFFVGHDIIFEADATDPGSDDLTFTWNWDDLSPDDAATYYNDGVGPDPYPSTDGTYPFAASDAQTHAFMAADTYNVTLTVTDDDGGLTVIVIVIILV